MPETTRRDFLRTVGPYGAAVSFGWAGGRGGVGGESVQATARHPFGYPEGGLDGEMNCLTCHIDLKEKRVTAAGHDNG